MEKIRTRVPRWKKLGYGIRDKHPGSATLYHILLFWSSINLRSFRILDPGLFRIEWVYAQSASPIACRENLTCISFPAAEIIKNIKEKCSMLKSEIMKKPILSMTYIPVQLCGEKYLHFLFKTVASPVRQNSTPTSGNSPSSGSKQ